MNRLWRNTHRFGFPESDLLTPLFSHHVRWTLLEDGVGLDDLRTTPAPASPVPLTTAASFCVPPAPGLSTLNLLPERERKQLILVREKDISEGLLEIIDSTYSSFAFLPIMLGVKVF